MQDTIKTNVVYKFNYGNVTELRLRKPVGFSFTSGQFLDFYGPDNLPRPYSMASAPEADVITLYVKKIPSGVTSTYICDELKTGDEVRIGREVNGYFNVGQTDKPFVFIGTGTGVAPFLSYLDQRKDKPLPELMLYGCRFINECVLRKEHQDQDFLNVCVSQDDVKVFSNVFQGRVTDYIKNNWEIKTDYIYYLCGLDSMLLDVTKILTDAGVPVENIFHEIFYFTNQ
jgi:ferredoxin-NADP reductase